MNSSKAPVIDSHQHFWDRSLSDFDHSWQEQPGFEPICRNFLPSDLYPLMIDAGVDFSILVQTQHHVDENRWALDLAEQNDFIAGVVGWVDLTSNQCEQQLLRFKDHSKFVGIRHVTQDEPDPDFIVGSEVRRGLRVLEKHNVPFDLLFYKQHLRHAPTVARAHPGLPLVIDHLSKPDVRRGELEPWRSELAAAADCDNVWCKLSGLVTEADWKHWSTSNLWPYVETALELFGPARLMFGSDWPVCELAATYGQVIEAMRRLLQNLTRSEQEMIFGLNALNFYHLQI